MTMLAPAEKRIKNPNLMERTAMSMSPYYDQAAADRLYVVEWRSSAGSAWITPTRNMHDCTFTDPEDAYEYAMASDVGERRIVTWRRESVEFFPEPSDAELMEPVEVDRG